MALIGISEMQEVQVGALALLLLEASAYIR
jgi:hypothetical protein